MLALRRPVAPAPRPGQTRWRVAGLGQNRPMPAFAACRRRTLIACGLLPLAAHPAWAAAQRPALRVGPGEVFRRMADALRAATDGDTIEVQPGNYRGDVAVITQRQLTIIGLGAGAAGGPAERPVFEAGGRHAEGKAIWVLRDGDIRIENIVFRGARVPDGNGAGIRFERGRLRLRRCSFIDNQMGLLTGNDEGSELDIQACEFADAPDNPGSLPHLLYVGRIGRLSVTDSVLRNGRAGHLLKSRARESTIVGNRLDDGRHGEASYEIDLPNGGVAHVEGNTLVQSPLTQNPVMLSFGAEGKPWPDSRLTVADNTFINHRAAGGVFVRAWADRLPAGAPVQLSHNRLLGPGTLELGPNGSSEQDSHGPAPATD